MTLGKKYNNPNELPYWVGVLVEEEGHTAKMLIVCDKRGSRESRIDLVY